jgi:hypothetical protein
MVAENVYKFIFVMQNKIWCARQASALIISKDKNKWTA